MKTHEHNDYFGNSVRTTRLYLPTFTNGSGDEEVGP